MKLFLDLGWIPGKLRFVGWDSKAQVLIVIRKSDYVSDSGSSAIWKFELYPNIDCIAADKFITAVISDAGDTSVPFDSAVSVINGSASHWRAPSPQGTSEYRISITHPDTFDIHVFTKIHLDDFMRDGMKLWHVMLHQEFNPLATASDQSYAW